MEFTESNNSWLVKWQYIIDRRSYVIREHGKENVVFNVDAIPDPVEQFKKYELACETVKNIYEAVVYKIRSSQSPNRCIITQIYF